MIIFKKISTLKLPKLFLFSILSFLVFNPLYAQNNTPKINAWFETQSQNKLFQNSPIGDHLGISHSYVDRKFSSNLFMIYEKNKGISFDGTSLNYHFKNSTIGFGKIKRKWSFAPENSLFLSENARPAKSIYIQINKLSDDQGANIIAKTPWSFELFNSVTSNTKGPKNSKMLGARATIMPIKNLEFELIKISQWGGHGHDNSIFLIPKVFFGNTNDGNQKNINQVAGIGASYEFPKKLIPFRIYAQVLGEDEAGNLPSCLINLVGFEWAPKKIHNQIKIGLELIDTRTHLSTQKFCGTNAAYNNSVYKYTNHDVVMGAPIDTQGKLITFWTSGYLSKNIFVNYSVKNILVNEFSLPEHRLASTKQKGWMNSLSLTWLHKNKSVTGKVNYKEFKLDRNSEKSRFNLSLLVEIEF
ncbi:capsule assembly Wzi family protein [Amylibacter sp.]|nr:capsule assembly Wzi family protein [Amylibacter sp.]